MVWPLQPSSSDSGLCRRRRRQVLHEHDACCFGAGSRPEAHPPITGTRHAQILAYNRAVQAERAESASSAALAIVHDVDPLGPWRWTPYCWTAIHMTSLRMLRNLGDFLAA
eukprot:COSAG04_NODE_8886_length_921_cov_0.575426_2_plen_111_part_00